MLHEVVHECQNIRPEDIEFLSRIEEQIHIVADLSRADILLYGLKSLTEAYVLAHAQPHSLAHVYLKDRVGRVIPYERRPEILNALTTGASVRDMRSFITEGAPVVREAIPIYTPCPLLDCGDPALQHCPRRIIAAVSIVTNLIEYERHRLRSPIFRRALRQLQLMMQCAQVHGAEKLTQFGEQDGILFTDGDGVIRYVSGIATNLYRRIGYRDALIGRHLSALETEDEEIRREALLKNRALEHESTEADRVWVRKAIPLVNYTASSWPWLTSLNLIPKRVHPHGVLISLHDATEKRRQSQEIQVKNAMIQEVHHRVKNNLQTIAALLRMQIRRVQSPDGKEALEEALNRILSVAVIHEFLSKEDAHIINIREVSHRIITQFQHGVLDPSKHIRMELTAEPVFLPARQATACSLIINELMQNAIEHGFVEQDDGIVNVNLEDSGDEVIIEVIDNGVGLPKGFALESTNSLGLHIVKILVESDLKGQFTMVNGANRAGVTATVRFPKTILKGETGWNEHELS